MGRRLIALLAVSVVAIATLFEIEPVPAATVGGVTFQDSVRITTDGPELILNGAGERRILLLRIYAIALYLPSPAHSLNDAIALKGPKRMHMVMLRNEITAKQVHDHVVARIEDGSQPAEMALMKTRLAELDRIIEAERVINLGGSIMLDFVPGKGTIIRVDGAQKGDPIPGEDFYDALLRIWLGDKAKSITLRDQLLGRG
jgi:chalcone isomerase-like protein